MSGQPRFVNPFYRPQCLAAAAPAGKAKLTHPGKAILAGKEVCVRVGSEFLHRRSCTQRRLLHLFKSLSTLNLYVQMYSAALDAGSTVFLHDTNECVGSVHCALCSDGRKWGTCS